MHEGGAGTTVSAERTVRDERGLFLLLVKPIERIIPASPATCEAYQFWLQSARRQWTVLPNTDADQLATSMT